MPFFRLFSLSCSLSFVFCFCCVCLIFLASFPALIILAQEKTNVNSYKIANSRTNGFSDFLPSNSQNVNKTMQKPCIFRLSHVIYCLWILKI